MVVVVVLSSIRRLNQARRVSHSGSHLHARDGPPTSSSSLPVFPRTGNPAPGPRLTLSLCKIQIINKTPVSVCLSAYLIIGVDGTNSYEICRTPLGWCDLKYRLSDPRRINFAGPRVPQTAGLLSFRKLKPRQTAEPGDKCQEKQQTHLTAAAV